ncbi:hypothetical protein VN97_g7573 [Penicillium thymicola]|uniref:Major facilitator superfamily (MFS) profile domain-containing protein n=1 Tax=Penicillium thymicola TaxID=293382 RepID=A0AAI9TF14_PENTH|nr:hypothetical protein VN97_g7573 [Penicillium thymicola]
MDHENETAPLLGPRRSRSSLRPQNPHLATSLLSLCIFFLSGATAIVQVPLTQLMEDNLCDRYLGEIGRQDSIDIAICKVDRIQSKLAYLNASFGVIESVTSLIAAFPYGVLADKLGRKPIIYLSNTGTVLYLAYVLAVLKFSNLLAIEYILLGPLFTLIGGGSTVINAGLYSLASDLVPDTDITISYFVMAFGSLSGSSAGPAISSKLMEKYSPWLPILIGTLMVPASMGLLVFLPEVITLRDDPLERDASEWGELSPSTFKSRFSQSWTGLKTSIQRLRSLPIVLILITYLRVNPEGIAYGQLLMQYVSKRFDWTFADVGYLLTARGITQMLVLLVLFPVISKLLSKYLRPAAKDLMLGRVSACLVIFGALLTGASHISLVIFGLILQTSGAGLSAICRSIAMSYMPSHDKSKMNTMIGFSETLGSLFAGPALAWLFALGMKFNGVWFGLSYFGLAAWCGICLLGLFILEPVRDQELMDIDETQPLAGSDAD